MGFVLIGIWMWDQHDYGLNGSWELTTSTHFLNHHVRFQHVQVPLVHCHQSVM